MQRHHGELSIFSNAMPSDLRRAPIFSESSPPPGAEVALRGAVIDTKSRRVTETTGRIGVAHQRDVAACPQRLPGIGCIVGAGDL